MKRATKLATLALLAGTAVTLSTMSASAFGGMGGRGGHGGPGGMGPERGGFMQMEFADVDLDKNGQITVEDLVAGAKARFDEADSNGDGTLTVDELKAQVESRMAERMANGGGKNAGNGAGKNGPGKNGAGKQGRWAPSPEKRMTWMAEQMLEHRDANGDGVLTADELTPPQAQFERMIDRFDTDDDNAISEAEFDQAQKEMWLKHQGRRAHGGGKGGFGGQGRNGG